MLKNINKFFLRVVITKNLFTYFKFFLYNVIIKSIFFLNVTKQVKFFSKSQFYIVKIYY